MHIRLRAEELERLNLAPNACLSSREQSAGSVRNRNVLSDFISA